MLNRTLKGNGGITTYGDYSLDPSKGIGPRAPQPYVQQQGYRPAQPHVPAGVPGMQNIPTMIPGMPGVPVIPGMPYPMPPNMPFLLE